QAEQAAVGGAQRRELQDDRSHRDGQRSEVRHAVPARHLALRGDLLLRLVQGGHQFQDRPGADDQVEHDGAARRGLREIALSRRRYFSMEYTRSAPRAWPTSVLTVQ